MGNAVPSSSRGGPVAGHFHRISIHFHVFQEVYLAPKRCLFASAEARMRFLEKGTITRSQTPSATRAG